MKKTFPNKKNKGSALILSLVLLTILTLLTFTASHDAILQEKMSSNLRNEFLAFEAAESALRSAEQWLTELTTKPIASDNANQGIYSKSSIDTDQNSQRPWWLEAKTSDWNNLAKTTLSNNLPNQNENIDLAFDLNSANEVMFLPIQPQYIIEELKFVRDTLNQGQHSDHHGKNFYQITAKGVGINNRSQVILQSTLARRF